MTVKNLFRYALGVVLFALVLIGLAYMYGMNEVEHLFQ